jgi:hypothetical protein
LIPLANREPRKFQAPKTKSQINPDDLNSKFQTKEAPAGVQKDITTDRSGSAKRRGTAVLNVLVIEY